MIVRAFPLTPSLLRNPGVTQQRRSRIGITPLSCLALRAAVGRELPLVAPVHGGPRRHVEGHKQRTQTFQAQERHRFSSA